MDMQSSPSSLNSTSESRPKIYERNPDTGVIRWRYVGESMEKYGWPNYGNILDVPNTQERKERVSFI